ncbi:hypothetical protein QYE76_034944 [Lolium multiflorum]|uniref:CCHC-type domain-containing protein n=1 Tax=Lolium multiflorum TaxID=4521 RepID=A0AAD8VMZ8_LOLMU|nr:hypothetical protein QYE76_034944 [Lolium multiflorum]
MIREGESVADAYARLGALRARVKGLGVEKYNDGFEMNEAFIKSKVIAMIAVKQEDTNLALNLQIMTKSADLNSDDLVSYVAANENMAKAGKRLMAMNRVDEASHNHEAPHNLALKARADHGSKEDYEIEEDEEMTSTSDMATDFAFFAKKYKAKFPMLLNDKKKKRTCYNCDEDSHFANECPYEERVDKPRFIKGVKPRLKPNPINDRYKKNKGRAFVGAEYLSDDEEEDEEKEAGVAGLAFSKPGSLFTYDYSKDYSTENDVGSSFMARITQDDDSDDSTSSTIVGSCLMARETKWFLRDLTAVSGCGYGHERHGDVPRFEALRWSKSGDVAHDRHLEANRPRQAINAAGAVPRRHLPFSSSSRSCFHRSPRARARCCSGERLPLANSGRRISADPPPPLRQSGATGPRVSTERPQPPLSPPRSQGSSSPFSLSWSSSSSTSPMASPSGSWRGSYMQEDDIERLVRLRRIPQSVITRVPGEEVEPEPRPGERVVFGAHLDRGLGLPASTFFRQFLDHFGLQPHHLAANACVLLSCFVAFMEAYAGLWPDIDFWSRLFFLKAHQRRPLASLRRRPRSTPARYAFPKIPTVDSVKNWQMSFFYVRNEGLPTDQLPEFNPAPPSESTGATTPARRIRTPR